MAAQAQLILNGRAARNRAIDWINRARINSRVTFKGPKRSVLQNDRMWAMLTDVSQQALWAGKKRTTHEWKDLFTGAVKMAGGVEAVPGLEGGLMLLGLHTSDLSKAEMSELIDYIAAWGAMNGVVFQEPADERQTEAA